MKTIYESLSAHYFSGFAMKRNSDAPISEVMYVLLIRWIQYNHHIEKNEYGR